MPIQSPEKVLQEVKKKKFDPCYLLHGEESFYIDEISDLIEKTALSESEKAFNQIILYGKDTNVGQILQQARRYPMMAEQQVVIVKEFQQTPDLNQAEAKTLLSNYLKKPSPSTILVLSHKNKGFNKKNKLYEDFKNNTTVVETKKIPDYKISEWLQGYAAQKQIKITPKAGEMLLEAIGADLSRLRTEIDKLLVNHKGTIDEHAVEQNIGISKDYNVFELQNAIALKKVTQIQKILNYWEANPKASPVIPTLGLLFSFFCKLLLAHQAPDKTDKGLASELKLNPFVVKNYYLPALRNYPLPKVIAIIGFLREADLQAKGIKTNNLPDIQISKELLGKILAV